MAPHFAPFKTSPVRRLHLYCAVLLLLLLLSWRGVPFAYRRIDYNCFAVRVRGDGLRYVLNVHTTLHHSQVHAAMP